MITTYTLFNNLVIAASGTAYSSPVSVNNSNYDCSLFFQSHDETLTGIVTVLYELSLDNINWSQDGSDLLTAFTKTSGPASDGKTFLEFSLPLASWFRIKVIETEGISPVYITTILGIT